MDEAISAALYSNFGGGPEAVSDRAAAGGSFWQRARRSYEMLTDNLKSLHISSRARPNEPSEALTTGSRKPADMMASFRQENVDGSVKVMPTYELLLRHSKARGTGAVVINEQDRSPASIRGPIGDRKSGGITHMWLPGNKGSSKVTAVDRATTSSSSPGMFTVHNNPVAVEETRDEEESSSQPLQILAIPDPRASESRAVAKVASDRVESFVPEVDGRMGARSEQLEGRPTPSPFDLRVEDVSEIETEEVEGNSMMSSVSSQRRLGVAGGGRPLGEANEAEAAYDAIQTSGAVHGSLLGAIPFTLREWCNLRQRIRKIELEKCEERKPGQYHRYVQSRSCPVAEATLDELEEELLDIPGGPHYRGQPDASLQEPHTVDASPMLQAAAGTRHPRGGPALSLAALDELKRELELDAPRGPDDSHREPDNLLLQLGASQTIGSQPDDLLQMPLLSRSALPPRPPTSTPPLTSTPRGGHAALVSKGTFKSEAHSDFQSMSIPSLGFPSPRSTHQSEGLVRQAAFFEGPEEQNASAETEEEDDALAARHEPAGSMVSRSEQPSPPSHPRAYPRGTRGGVKFLLEPQQAAPHSDDSAETILSLGGSTEGDLCVNMTPSRGWLSEIDDDAKGLGSCLSMQTASPGDSLRGGDAALKALQADDDEMAKIARLDSASSVGSPGGGDKVKAGSGIVRGALWDKIRASRLGSK